MIGNPVPWSDRRVYRNNLVETKCRILVFRQSQAREKKVGGMIKRAVWKGFCMKIGWMTLGFVILVTLVGGEAAVPLEPRQRLPADELFQDGRIPRLRIEVPAASLNALRSHARTYVSATIREGNVTYTNVSIRLKGGPGSFRPLDDKPAFTVNFDRLAEGQKFHGLRKLHLNNSVQDGSYLSEKVARELFNAAGVPTPRAAHATVELNGDNLGFYVLIEGIDKQFLRRTFKDAKGNLYDGHSGSDVNRGMEVNSGDAPRDHSGLRALAAAVQEPDLDTRWARLQKTLDVDRFLSFLAVEVITCHWDGYALNRNNFRVFHDRENGRMVFLPQGVDQTFQRQNIPPIPQTVGLLTRSILEIPEARERYQQRMSQLLTNVFDGTAITNHVQEVAAKMRPYLAVADPQSAAGHPTRVASLCRRIQQRLQSLERQLTSPSVAAKLDKAESLALPTWEPKIDIGNPSLAKEHEKDGKTLLRVGTDERCAASWRTRVLLDRGQYRLQGKVRLQGVKLAGDDPKAGAGLRISRGKFSRKLSGDMDWTVVPFDFEVQQDRMDVELVCELRATQGKAWFDVASLRLMRRE